MPLLSPQDFKVAAAKRRKTLTVDVEGLGAFKLRALSAGDAQRFQADVKKAQADGQDPEALAFALIARSWIDEDGGPWMPEAEGIDAARSLDPDAYGVLAKAVLKLNGLDEKAIEDAEKNSGRASRDESTPTDSLKNLDTPTSI